MKRIPVRYIESVTYLPISRSKARPGARMKATEHNPVPLPILDAAQRFHWTLPSEDYIQRHRPEEVIERIYENE